MDIYRKFKLYRIKTVLKYISQSWEKSAIPTLHSNQPRLVSFISLLYWDYSCGFNFNNYCSFKFWKRSSAEKKSYISFRRNDVLRYRLSNPESYNIFLDKALFNERFNKFILRDWKLLSTTHPVDDLDTFIINHPDVIVKPVSDYGGHGVKKVSKGSDANLKHSIFKDNNAQFIVEERIENNDNLKRLAPGSLNTIRIVTLIDKSGELNILACVLRMGNGTAFTDNYHDGGIACAINQTTGCLQGKAYGMNCVEYESHPFSGIKFDGYRIDDFSKCLDLVKELIRVVPDARYVGWDLALTPSGIEVIEGNIPPGENITQIASGKGLWYEILNKI